jgi:hypothetical protein
MVLGGVSCVEKVKKQIFISLCPVHLQNRYWKEVQGITSLKDVRNGDSIEAGLRE